MNSIRLGDKGFSLTELMFAMTIMAVGLLALAQMQIMAVRGTANARDFSIATNLAREGIERVKFTGVYKIDTGNVFLSTDSVLGINFIADLNTNNEGDTAHAPEISTTTNITSDLQYDTIEVLRENEITMAYEWTCKVEYGSGSCSNQINNEEWDFVRITNVRNLPSAAATNEQKAVMKDVNVIVLWKENNNVRSVNLRTIVARKDVNFF